LPDTFAITLAAINMNSNNEKQAYEINSFTLINHRSGGIGAGRLQSKQSRQFNRDSIPQLKYEPCQRHDGRSQQYAGNQQHAEHEYEYAGKGQEHGRRQ